MGDAHIVHICLRDGIEVDLHGDVAIVFPLEAMGKLKAVDVGGFILYNLCAGSHMLGAGLDEKTVDACRGVGCAVKMAVDAGHVISHRY